MLYSLFLFYFFFLRSRFRVSDLLEISHLSLGFWLRSGIHLIQFVSYFHSNSRFTFKIQQNFLSPLLSGLISSMLQVFAVTFRHRSTRSKFIRSLPPSQRHRWNYRSSRMSYVIFFRSWLSSPLFISMVLTLWTLRPL